MATGLMSYGAFNSIFSSSFLLGLVYEFGPDEI